MAISQIALGFASGAKLFTDTDNGATVIAVVAAAATVYELELDNTANAAQDNYVKIYNSAGAVTVGTTVPDYVFEIPQGTKRSIVIPDGLSLTLGLQVATLTAGGTAGTTGPTSDFVVKMVYV
jgi:hypothetical protein